MAEAISIKIEKGRALRKPLKGSLWTLLRFSSRYSRTTGSRQ
jgi:hypothetical protein